jgi:hypothetical protein
MCVIKKPRKREAKVPSWTISVCERMNQHKINREAFYKNLNLFNIEYVVSDVREIQQLPLEIRA